MNPFSILEIDLVRRSGLTRELVRSFRAAHLREGSDYARNGRWIAYTEAAATQLMALAGVMPEQVELPTAPALATQSARSMPKSLPLVPGSVVKLFAWRTAEHGIRNDRILEAYLPGSDPSDRANIVRVRVSSNRNFVRDMELWGRLEHDDLYELWNPERNQPERAPRARGRW